MIKRFILSAAKRVRHSPYLANAEGLWNIVRPLYRKALAAGGRGVPVSLAGVCTVRLPVESTGDQDWSDYEKDGIRELVGWLDAHPAGVVVDVGCSHGIYSLAALSAARQARVVAIDADAPSLLAAQQMTRFA